MKTYLFSAKNPFLIIIMLPYMSPFCSCRYFAMEESENHRNCTWCWHCRLGFLSDDGIPPDNFHLPFIDYASRCTFLVVQCICLYPQVSLWEMLIFIYAVFVELVGQWKKIRNILLTVLHFHSTFYGNIKYTTDSY